MSWMQWFLAPKAAHHRPERALSSGCVVAVMCPAYIVTAATAPRGGDAEGSWRSDIAVPDEKCTQCGLNDRGQCGRDLLRTDVTADSPHKIVGNRDGRSFHNCSLYRWLANAMKWPFWRTERGGCQRRSIRKVGVMVRIY